MILITAATGQSGRLVVEALLQKVAARDLAVAVRHPEKAREWSARSVSVRQADYDDLSSLHAAFDGIRHPFYTDSLVNPGLLQDAIATGRLKDASGGKAVNTASRADLAAAAAAVLTGSGDFVASLVRATSSAS